MSPLDHLPVLLLALVLDAMIGDPDWLYRRVPHPVALIGRAIGWLDRAWNRDTHTDTVRRSLGIAGLTLILTLVGGAGWLLQEGARSIPHGALLEALIASLFLAQQSLYRHVSAVAAGFLAGGLSGARLAVSRIVGRDPDRLDEAGICRAAIESLAENFSDGVVAPAFWFLLFGLPGLLAYKALNTADSMIGHLDDRHRAFGWAAARLDDLANVVPARLSAIALSVAAAVLPGASMTAALRATSRDAGRHRSVNAGWPEAAMAGALDIRIAGPRYYAGTLVDDAWMGNGRAEVTPADIRRGLDLYCAAIGVLAVIGAMTGAATWMF